ncbi:MAG TPA: MBOAT family protein [Candidatus Melainabacteria bacterium]|nr:MBOAT family protein [Candidatus Melainabacteria bacterium]HIN63953.1 MBOAT family protein [Candidatus Obscuribacterales bacterium]
MLFNSINYLLFFPVVFACYWIAPSKLKRPLLLLASYLFYMSWLPAYGLLILGMTIVNFVFGKIISANATLRKPVFVLAIVFNLGTLCFYKYTNFLLENLALAVPYFAHLKSSGDLAVNIILPLGISFFAFEFIHYVSDVYKGDKPIKKFVDFALFASFFPSQIAGPIKRYQDFMAQLCVPAVLSSDKVYSGARLILQGLFKKAALADNLAILANAGFQHTSSLGTADAWVAVAAFTLQIYFDFSGYTDMGRGSALMLGYSLPDNFNLPYIAVSLTDFWKRWHISLSTWLRDYLYIPLGGGRCSQARKSFNLLATMLLGGLWHGAAWHFVMWGGFHGLGLTINHAYDGLASRSKILTAFNTSIFGRAFFTTTTLLAVAVGWVFFRADTVGQALSVLHHMVVFQSSSDVVALLDESSAPMALGFYSVYALFAWLEKSNSSRVPAFELVSKCLSRPLVKVSCYMVSFVLALAFCPKSSEPFIYFQF